MKQAILSIGAAIVAISGAAQTLVKEMDGADTRFIPGAYMKSGEAAIYFSENEYGYDSGDGHNAQIYDFNLNPLKTFQFQTLKPYSVVKERAQTGTVERRKTIERESGELTGVPAVSDMEARKAAFIRYLCEQYWDSRVTEQSLKDGCEVVGTTIFVALPLPEGYVQYQEYLKRVRAYFTIDNKVGYEYLYAATVPEYKGEWKSTTYSDSPISNFCTPRCVDVSNMNHWNGGVFLPFSQTFFNDDEKFEYVRYKAKIAAGSGTSDVYPDGSDPLKTLFGITRDDRDGDGETDITTIYYSVHHTGIEVVTEDGKVLYTFDIPGNNEGNVSVEFFKSSDCILAQVDFFWQGENDDYMHTTRFYRVDKNSGVAKVVREESRMVAWPNPAARGSDIEMVLPAGSNPRMLTVTTVNGAKVFDRYVAPGSAKVSVSTGRLSSGSYIVTLTEDGRIIESSKIIIR